MINIAELLKDCPSGMELDCTMWDNVSLIRVLDGLAYPIRIETPCGLVLLDEYGCYSRNEHAKCVIFPKGKTTWEGFVPPCKFKDGDVLTYMYNNKPTIYIYRENGCCNTSFYAGYSFYNESFYKGNIGGLSGDRTDLRLATEEEKEKLSQAIKDNGYRWNAEAKTLEKLDEPKFKDGDILSNGICICLYNGNERDKYYGCYAAVGHIDYPNYFINHPQNSYFTKENSRLATEEEKQRLFNIIKTNGYKWNAETKTLEKLDEPKFKDGDILSYQCGGFKNRTVYIYRYHKTLNTSYYVALSGDIDSEFMVNYLEGSALNAYNDTVRFATEEEKQKLFDAIKANRYKWNAETKTLEKLIVPKFKAGDYVTKKGGIIVPVLITSVSDEYYYSNTGDPIGFFRVKDQDDWELAPNKFDITTLKPFDKVLVRTDKFTPVWTIAFFDGYQPDIGGSFCSFGVSGGEFFQQCIPYEGNEHLRGTTKDCDDFYKIW